MKDKAYTLQIKKYVLILFAACLFVFATPQAHAYSNVDTVIRSLTNQILQAHYIGDNEQVVQLFSVLFQVLMLNGDALYGTAGLTLENLDINDISEDKAEFEVEIDWGSADRAWVWFEYGEDEDELEYETSRVSLDDDDDELEERVRNLDEDERYYVQAVAENRDNDKISRSSIESFRTDDEDEDEVELDIERADNITDDSAEIRGEVDMNDFRNGLVFFVWGEDEDQVEDIERDYDEYRDIDEDGEDLQKQRVDYDLDDREDYELEIEDLDRDTRIYFSICVEYEDNDDDELIECSEVEDFRTDD